MQAGWKYSDVIGTMVAPESSIPAAGLIKLIKIEQPDEIRSVKPRVQDPEFTKQGGGRCIVEGDYILLDKRV